MRSELQRARALGEQLLTLAQQVRDVSMLCAAHRALGSTLLFLGVVADAQTHFAQGIAFYDSQQHRASVFLYVEDTGVACHSLATWTLWHLGSPAQGLARNDETLTLVQQSTNLYSLAYALSLAAIFHQFRREEDAAQACAEACIKLATEQGFLQWKA